MIKLGKTNIEVTSIGIGAWAWGDSFFWDYGKKYGQSDIKEAFDESIKVGITFFDTAEVYGKGESERLLGEFMKNCNVPVTIATKYAPLPWRLNENSISKAVQKSLSLLQIEQIPLYQVHWPFMLMSQNTLINALANEVEKGTILAIGVSNYSSEQMKQAAEILGKRNIPLAVNQVKYSLLSRKVETKGIVATAKELDVTLLAYSPLEQGVLTGKYHQNLQLKPEGARKIDPRFNLKGLNKTIPVINLLTELGEKYQKTPAQVALNWLICQENVIPIPGAKNGKQARENAGAIGWFLTSEEVDKLSTITNAYK